MNPRTRPGPRGNRDDLARLLAEAGSFGGDQSLATLNDWLAHEIIEDNELVFWCRIVHNMVRALRFHDVWKSETDR